MSHCCGSRLSLRDVYPRVTPPPVAMRRQAMQAGTERLDQVYNTCDGGQVVQSFLKMVSLAGVTGKAKLLMGDDRLWVDATETRRNFMFGGDCALARMLTHQQTHGLKWLIKQWLSGLDSILVRAQSNLARNPGKQLFRELLPPRLSHVIIWHPPAPLPLAPTVAAAERPWKDGHSGVYDALPEG